MPDCLRAGADDHPPSDQPLARVEPMTTEVYIRVWENTPDRRGTRKLLLLALARFARDSLGICWPSHETIAAMINEDRDYVRKLLAQAKDDGDIVLRSGLGRGNPTIYGVAVGLNSLSRH